MGWYNKMYVFYFKDTFLKQGIDKRCYNTRLGENDKGAQNQENQDNWYQPIPFSIF